MPKPPSWLDKVNYVVDFWEDPCNAPWTVYAQTALPAAGNMYIQLIEGGALDAIRAATRPQFPRGFKSRTGKRGSARRRRGGGGLTNPVERAGSKLRGSVPLPGKTDSTGLATLWQIDGVLQRGLFAYLIADITIDGLYNWATLVQESSYCQEKPNAAIWWPASNVGAFPILDWRGFLLATPMPDPLPWGWGASRGFCVNPYDPWGMAVWGTAANRGNIPATIQLGFWVENPVTEEPDIKGPEQLVGPFGFATPFAKVDCKADQSAIWAMKVDGGDLTIFNMRGRAG